MKNIICHETALEYWRIHRIPPFTNRGEIRRDKPPPSVLATAERLQDEFSCFTKPLHFLVCEENGRRKSETICTHHGSDSFSWGSFYECSENVLVSSPELCFLQMANQLSLIELIQLGFELCGTYCRPVHSDFITEIVEEQSQKGFVNCNALTSVARLTKFISRVSGMHGRKRAMQAVQFIANNSASPMETNLAILLTLPYRFGGYGLPMPILNYQIQGGAFCCDLFWPQAKLAVEYDSNQFHTGAKRIAKDSRRRGALALLGIEVVTITWQQISSTVKLREAATLIGKNLGKRLTFKDPDFTNRHLVLRAQLF